MKQSAKILLVDDEPGMLRYIKTLLEVDDYRVETATTGEEALVIPGGFAVGTEPFGEATQNVGDSIRHRQRTEERGRTIAVRHHS